MAGYLKEAGKGSILTRLESGELEFATVVKDIHDEAIRITGLMLTRQHQVDPEEGRQPWARLHREEQLGRIVIDRLNEFGETVSDHLPELMQFVLNQMRKGVDLIVKDPSKAESVMRTVDWQFEKFGALSNMVANLKAQVVASAQRN